MHRCPAGFNGIHHQVRQRAGQCVAITAQGQSTIHRRHGQRGAGGLQPRLYMRLEVTEHVLQADQLRAWGRTAYKTQHAFYQAFHMHQALGEPVANTFPLRDREVRPAQLRQIQRGGRQRRANLVRQSRRHFTQRAQALFAAHLRLQVVQFGGVGHQHQRLALLRQTAAMQREVPLRLALAYARLNRGPVFTQQRLAKQRHRFRVGVAHLLPFINQQDTARQHGHQGCQPLQQTLLLGQLIQPRRARGRELLVEARYPRFKVAVGGIQLM